MGAVVAVPLTVALNLISGGSADFTTLCKWIYSYSYILLSRLLTKKRFDLYDFDVLNDPQKANFLPHQLEIDLEAPQPDSHLLHAADEIFFYGVNSKSEAAIVRIARTVNHEAEAWIYLKLDGKIYNLHKTSGYQNSSSDCSREFTCGGLRVHYISPMRRWRIFYNGLLRETSEDDSSIDRLVYVKFAFLWSASSDLYDMTTDINSVSLSLALGKSKWKSCELPLKKLQHAFNFYAQSGNIHGTITVDGESSDRRLYLYGERMRFLGDTMVEHGSQFTHVLGQIPRNGTIIHIAKVTIPGVVKELELGFVVLPDGRLESLPDVDLQFKIVPKEGTENIRALFHANDIKTKLKGQVTGKVSRFESNKGWDGSLTIDWLNIEMNQTKGYGILITGNLLKPSMRSLPKVSSKETTKERPLVVHFSEEPCEISELTGGKGSSLGKLTQLRKHFQNFIVPNGVVVTTSAYEEFLNSDIRKEIRSLEDVLYGKTSGDVKEACQRVMNEVIKANVPDTVYQAVVKCLQKTFGEQMHTKKFAIRSSATGEDTEQMSAAGQMETYLGISGLSEIMSSVKKCWASQFGFIAVQYKKQNGQIVNSPMAVVIQEMITCDVAGVLFTCDPLTGNPSCMSITANYGLGESVVSGSEEPDTIELTRTEEDELKIAKKTIGAKAHRIVVREDEGTSLQEVSETEKSVCCLSDTMALRLGNIAIQIEKNYRSNRDIEWGFWNNNLYIFQSRPVTSGAGETDYEIDHEVDSPLRIDNEYFTVCNVGEVMNGALSPLGIDVLLKYFVTGMSKKKIETEYQSSVRPVYFRKIIMHMDYHMMFYAVDLMEKINEGRQIAESVMVAMYGRILDDEDMYRIAMERYGANKKQSAIMKNIRILKSLFLADKRLNGAKKSLANYHLPVEKLKTSEEVFNAIMFACTDTLQALLCHNLASQSSSIWNMIVMNIIAKARGGINTEVYRDFAKLLTSISEVESADVPTAMQSLAYHISKEIKSEDFKKMDTEEIIQWLKTTPTEAGIRFRDFVQRHGHRCLKEFDIRSVTWGEDPRLLIPLLQNLVGNTSPDTSEKKVESIDKILDDLGLPLSFTSKFLLKNLLLPQCRKAVQVRELTKSFMIKLLDDWRKCYKYLAKLLTLEGRIPDPDLMFFMNLEEIQELIKTRSPKIISKANHRRRRYPILDKYIFPEIMKGNPKPVNLDDTPIIYNEDNFKMQGIPVSQGVAKGFVRVALTLEEASHLKPGEILLTYCTDIGWTPYFPSLAGVVTELGGLISHGAVVSREYGLPCIAGLHGATRQFQTGDYVLLDGNRGILQKLPAPQ